MNIKPAKTGIPLRILVTMVAALGWWGLFFPEFTLNKDTVLVYLSEASDSREETELTEQYSGEELLQLLLNAQPEQIHFRSKLFKEFMRSWEAFSWDKLTEN